MKNDLYLQGIGSALGNLGFIFGDIFSGKLADVKRTAKALICPIDFWRYIEFPFVLGHLANNVDRCRHILDVSSPKYLAWYIAESFNCKIVGTDIDPHIMEEINWYKRQNKKGNLTGKVEEATKLSFEDDSFSFIFSVSVLEHIGKDGDIIAIEEMARVLEPGGKLVITVPFVTEQKELWVNEDVMGCQIRSADGKVFFSRYYDMKGLYSRLIEPSDLKMVEMKAWQEIKQNWYNNTYIPRLSGPLPVKMITKFLDYYYCRKMVEPIGSDRLTNHGLAGIAFEKE
jgi:SAM-dependent methyltransferase